jgi:N4-gp56 family major capsid protein
MATTWNTITNISGGGAGSAGNSQAAANTFVPKLWSDEILVSREKNLVAASFFKRINHKGKKGDTIIIPLISNLQANDMSQVGAPIAPQVTAEGLKTVTLDKWKETSNGYNDLLMAQSRYDIRGEYTKKAGYALAERLDTDIFALFPATLSAAYKVIGSDGITQWDSTANGNTGNGADITDIGLRRMIQTLEDNLTPMDGVALFIPPSQKNAMLGIDKFTLFQNIGRTSELQRGTFGEIYGIPVKVSTNLPTVLATDGVTSYKVAILAHKDSVCSAIQMDVRTQAQYKIEYLSTFVVSDMIYGVAALRLDADDVTGSNHRLAQAVACYVK